MRFTLEDFQTFNGYTTKLKSEAKKVGFETLRQKRRTATQLEAAWASDIQQARRVEGTLTS
jgi:hypothetical protein